MAGLVLGSKDRRAGGGHRGLTLLYRIVGWSAACPSSGINGREGRREETRLVGLGKIPAQHVEGIPSIASDRFPQCWNEGGSLCEPDLGIRPPFKNSPLAISKQTSTSNVIIY